jgi:predicted Zn-dependent peptidase
MRLEPGVTRELHWHATAAERAFVLEGRVRTTVVDPSGGTEINDCFTADEVDKAKKIYADQQAVSRADEGSIAGILAGRERWRRTMEWDAGRDAAVAAVTVDQVNAAFQKHIGPLAISIVKGGDLKKAGVYQ